MNGQSGFSLIEMLVVMGIIGIVLSVMTPNYSRVLSQAKVSKAKMEVVHISNAVNMYYMDNNAYPTSLSQLTTGGSNAYLKALPLDPWQHAYVYSNNTVRSYGADGTAGGTLLNADIISTNNL